MSKRSASTRAAKKPTPKEYVIVYDLELKRPACVLLQAIMGGDSEGFRRFFGGAGDWLIAPTPGMRRVRATEDDWKKVAAHDFKDYVRS